MRETKFQNHNALLIVGKINLTVSLQEYAQVALDILNDTKKAILSPTTDFIKNKSYFDSVAEELKQSAQIHLHNMAQEGKTTFEEYVDLSKLVDNFTHEEYLLYLQKHGPNFQHKHSKVDTLKLKEIDSKIEKYERIKNIVAKTFDELDAKEGNGKHVKANAKLKSLIEGEKRKSSVTHF